MSRPGRSCPLSYRYGAQALRGAPALRAEALWVVGGLYGNTLALEALLEAFEGERGDKALVFNGDFHWFDVDPAQFARVNQAVLAHRATRGNVETELAQASEGSGCGCGYPDWVDQGTVDRSNRILERLRQAAGAVQGSRESLAGLPMFLRARVGEADVGIVHGDADSLAGWGFSQEALASPQGLESARAGFQRAQVNLFASSHTCLPVLQGFGDDRALVNNGAAGMPNFRGDLCGIATRIATTPYAGALYERQVARVHVSAVALRYDTRAWEARFLSQWPAGSDAHVSYYRRITQGPEYLPSQAVRGFQSATIAA